MKGGILRPAGGVRRVTANAGNRAFIKGGFHRKHVSEVEVPVFIGPTIPNQAASAGVPFAFDAGLRFDYPAGSVFAWAGPTGGWMTCHPDTGILSGSNPVTGTLTGRVSCTHNGLVAESNQFQVVTT
jgi:hypothetical protein